MPESRGWAAGLRGSHRREASEYDRLCQTIGDSYFYLHSKQIDWGGVAQHHKAMFLGAVDDHEAIRVLETLMDHLHDPHTHLRTHLEDSWRLPAHDIHASLTPSGAIVTDVRPSSAAELSGVVPGITVVGLDGAALFDALEARIPELVAPRDDPGVLAWALSSVLSGRRNRDRNLRVRNEAGLESEIVIPPEEPPATQFAELRPVALDRQLGYIAIPNFSERRMVRLFDRALATCADAGGLVLDVRGNPGGDTIVTKPIMGRFVARRTAYATMARRSPTGTERWTEYVEPRRKARFTGRTVILIDRWTASAAEGFAMGMREICGAILVGRPMAGLDGAVATTKLKRPRGITVQYVSEHVADVHGSARSLIVPDIEIEPSGDSASILIQHRGDDLVETAIRLAVSRQQPV